jgi:predicted ferric reductase
MTGITEVRKQPGPSVDEPEVLEPPRASIRKAGLALGVVGSALLVGYLLATALAPAVAANKLSWVLGRGLGIAAFLALNTLVCFGVWIRHPLRNRIGWPSPKDTLAIHASLGAATFALIAGHLTALALDPWAKIGWVGALVPWASSYRPTPVALGTLAVWAIVLVGFTARMAGRLGRARWLRIHRIAWLIWIASLLHGLTAGSDAMALRYVYAAAGAVVVAVWVSGRLIPPPRRRPAA